MTPITLRVQVTEVQTVLLAQVDIGHGSADLACDEGPATPRALVVEQDTVARIHPIRFTIVDGDPISIQFGNAVRAAWVERRRLALWRFDDLAIQFRGGGLVEPHVSLEPDGTNGIEKTEGAHAIDISCILGHLERDLDVRLGSEVVDLGREHLSEDVHEISAVGEVTIMQFELVGTLSQGLIRRVGGEEQEALTFMLIRIQMLQTIGIEAGGTTDDSVHLVAFFEEQLGTMAQGQSMISRLGRSDSQVRTVLTSDSCVEHSQ